MNSNNLPLDLGMNRTANITILLGIGSTAVLAIGHIPGRIALLITSIKEHVIEAILLVWILLVQDGTFKNHIFKDMKTIEMWGVMFLVQFIHGLREVCWILLSIFYIMMNRLRWFLVEILMVMSIFYFSCNSQTQYSNCHLFDLFPNVIPGWRETVYVGMVFLILAAHYHGP